MTEKEAINQLEGASLMLFNRKIKEFNIAICMAIGALQKQSNSGWIPCSKRMPKESGYYMACIYNSRVGDYDFRKTWFAHVDDYDMDESEWRELYGSEEVTAWQSLPEPYKGSE